MGFLFMFELNGVCILCYKNKRNVCFMKLKIYTSKLARGKMYRKTMSAEVLAQ